MNSQLALSAPAIIDELRGELAPILAENGQSFDRLRTVFMIAVQQNPDILRCSADSLRREISKCAADGLVPDSKEAVLLPYWDKEAKTFLANYQPMVYGVVKRMKELGSVFNIVCEIVCQKDTFSFNAADPDSLVHTWDVFSDSPRGETRAAYVIFRDDQKRVMHREIMTLAELQSVRNASKAPNSPAWRNFEGEMYQKAVLRRGSKYISINNDKIRALIERQDALFDLNASPAVERVDPFSGRTIEGASGRPALAHNPGATVDNGHRREREAVASRSDGGADIKTRHSSINGGHRDQRSEDAGSARDEQAEQKEEKKKIDLPEKPPELPDVSIKAEDVETATEVFSKVMRVANEHDLDPADRRVTLKELVPAWKKSLPDYLHPVLKACIEATDWSIRTAAEGKSWMGDHAAFVFKVKSLLGIEKLNVGKYPD